MNEAMDKSDDVAKWRTELVATEAAPENPEKQQKPRQPCSTYLGQPAPANPDDRSTSARATRDNTSGREVSSPIGLPDGGGGVTHAVRGDAGADRPTAVSVCFGLMLAVIGKSYQVSSPCASVALCGSIFGG